MKYLLHYIAILLLTQAVSASDLAPAERKNKIIPQLQELAAQHIAREIKQNPHEKIDLPESILSLIAHAYSLSVDQNLPKWLEPHLEEISIEDLLKHNYLERRFSGQNLSSLKGLEKIVIGSEGYLNISNNRLRSLSNNFNSLNNLYELDLQNNKLQTLPDDFNPPFVDALNLSHNQLQSLPNSFNPPNLYELNLCGNQLQDLPANFYPRRLEYLYLYNNPMSKQTIAALRLRLRPLGVKIMADY